MSFANGVTLENSYQKKPSLTKKEATKPMITYLCYVSHIYSMFAFLRQIASLAGVKQPKLIMILTTNRPGPV